MDHQNVQAVLCEEWLETGSVTPAEQLTLPKRPPVSSSVIRTPETPWPYLLAPNIGVNVLQYFGILLYDSTTKISE